MLNEFNDNFLLNPNENNSGEVCEQKPSML